MSPQRHAWRWVLLVVVVLILLAGWLAFRAWQIQHNLSAARSALATAETQLANGETLPQSLVESAASHTRTARDAARDPIWSAAARIPFLGRPLHTAGGIAEIGDRITPESLPILVNVRERMQQVQKADALHPLPLPVMRQAASGLGRVDTQLADDAFALRKLPESSAIHPIAHGRSLLLTQLDRVSARVHTAAVATKIGVPMLGGSGTRRYLVAFENPAEARPDMGLVGASAEMVARNGGLHVVKVDPDPPLPPIRPVPGDTAPVLTVGYRQFGPDRDWGNVNLSPDFSEDGALMGAMYAAGTRRRIDGVIAVDPATLGAVLTQTGQSVTLQGVSSTINGAVTVSGADLPAFLESGEYALPLDQQQRKAILAEVGRQTLHDLLQSHTSTINLARTLAHLAGTGSLRVFSSRDSEEAQLADFPIAGTLPPTAGRPFVGAYVTNSVGNKLDYYLDESVSWQSTSCGGDTARGTVSVTLTNGVPKKPLPTYVTQGNVGATTGLKRGDHRILLSIATGPG